MFPRRNSYFAIAVTIAAAAICFVGALEAREKAKGNSTSATQKAFSFPKSLGAFKREGAVKRDPAGNPIATYYAGRLVLIDMYYYKDPLPFAGEFANCEDYVKLVHPDSRLISEGTVRLHGTGKRAVFSFQARFLGGSKTKVLSELIMFPHNDRFLKFRATYPAAHAARARAEIDSFIRALLTR